MEQSAFQPRPTLPKQVGEILTCLVGFYGVSFKGAASMGTLFTRAIALNVTRMCHKEGS